MKIYEERRTQPDLDSGRKAGTVTLTISDDDEAFVPFGVCTKSQVKNKLMEEETMEMISTTGKHRTTYAAVKKSLTFAAVFVAALFMASCVAAIPIAIKYAKSANQTRAKAEIPLPAEKVYRTAVDLSKERGLQIVKEEDDKMYLEITDGVQTGSLKAEAAGADKTQITVIASVPAQEGEEKAQKKEREKELTLRIVDRLCERLKVSCSIVKE